MPLDVQFGDNLYKARGGSLFDTSSPPEEPLYKNLLQLRFTRKIVDLMVDDDGLDVIVDETQPTGLKVDEVK